MFVVSQQEGVQYGVLSIHDPEKKQAKLIVSLSASPTLSLSDPKAVLRLTVIVSIASTKEEHAAEPLTLCTENSVLQMAASGEGGIGIFVRRGRRGQGRGQGQEGRPHAATVTHELDRDRLLRYAEKRAESGVIPGGGFEVAMVKSFLGSRWWCWGDLDGDLPGKKLHVWHAHEGYYDEGKPQKDEGWALGEDPMHLDWEDVTEGGKTTFTIVK